MLRRILLVSIGRLTSAQRLGVEAYLRACKRSKRGKTGDEILVDVLAMYLPKFPPLRALNQKFKAKRNTRA
jgi:hypothetical protein